MPEEIIEIAKVSQRGSIVIPIEVRKRLGNLKEGDRAIFKQNGGKIFLEKV